MSKNIRPKQMERITDEKLANKFIAVQIPEIKAAVGDKHVILALSGGVDSLVVAALLDKAINKQLSCIHVNNGLMRKNESESVVEHFNKTFKAKLIYIDASERFLKRLEGVSNARPKERLSALNLSRFSRKRPESLKMSLSWLRGQSIPI